MNYQGMLALAQKHGYNAFTALQDCAFQNEDAYAYNKDLFIMGETSSGKTLIPLLLYSAALEKAEETGEEYPRMLFVVPYRALAAQKVREMQAFFKDKNLKIIQSTGEFRQDDDAIQNGQVHIAVIIIEKIYKYEARNPEFLSKYDYLVLDEIGLINNPDRGIRLDFILAWAENQKSQTQNPRTIALGTPFFDWNAYIESYHFTAIKTNSRPVKLDDTFIFYGKHGIRDVKKADGAPHPFLHRVRLVTDKEFHSLEKNYGVPATSCPVLLDEPCPMELPCRTNRDMMCSATGKPCINLIERIPNRMQNTFEQLILKICREHLKQNHQILIFINDRTRVMTLCRFLFENLQDDLPPIPSAEECKSSILADCQLEGDDVFGIMEHDVKDATEAEFYQAFKSGIGFHSAALPNELRTYVEEKLLDSRQMRIVCSTETLAFGVNSSVDVVVIADLYKYESSDNRPLSLNEYQNYAGRAGRLRPGTDSSDINGYVYTLVNEKQTSIWESMLEEGTTLEKLYSLFHKDQGSFMPFFLLNLLPTTSTSSITPSELIKIVRFLPQDGSVTSGELKHKIKSGLNFLCQKNLAVRIRSTGKGRNRMAADNAESRFCLTTMGICLRGYILGSSDYRALELAIEDYTKTSFLLEPNKAKFLYSLLCTKHAENGLKNIASDSTLLDLSEVRAYIQKHMAPEYKNDRWLKSKDSQKTLFILAAMLAWCDGESPKTLFRQFGLHYSLLNKLAEQIAYLVEISKEILPTQMENLYKKNEEKYNRMHFDYDNYMIVVDKKKEQLHDLFISIYYGINTGVIRSIYDFAADYFADAADEELLKELSMRFINPKTARKLRRIVIRYKFFQNPPDVDMNNIEMRNNFYDQLRQYKKDVKDFGPCIAAFFKKSFPDEFTD